MLTQYICSILLLSPYLYCYTGSEFLVDSIQLGHVFNPSCILCLLVHIFICILYLMSLFIRQGMSLPFLVLFCFVFSISLFLFSFCFIPVAYMNFFFFLDLVFRFICSVWSVFLCIASFSACSTYFTHTYMKPQFTAIIILKVFVKCRNLK